jgi:hypothetical protein
MNKTTDKEVKAMPNLRPLAPPPPPVVVKGQSSPF